MALDIVILVAGAYLVLINAYLVLVTATAYLFKKRSDPTAPPITVAVLIPAYNEELRIGATVTRLQQARYPTDHYTVFVIADNCDDRTAELARAGGATVLERSEPEDPGKGQALDWCVRTHAATLAKYDAVAIVDADTYVHPDFLTEVSASLSCPDVDLLQTFDGVANPDQNWRTALTYAGFALINHVRSCGRSRLGTSVGLQGNGMAFRTDLLLKYGWPAQSVVEDVQFSFDLLFDGHIVHYNPDAILTSEMPATRHQAASQRRRWELGRLQVAWRYVPKLLRAFVVRPRWRYLEAAFYLLVPPLSMLVMSECLLVLLALLWRPIWLPLALACVLGTCFHVGSGLYMSRVPKPVWLGLLAVPLFLLWKIPLYVKMLLSPNERTWVRTNRNAELKGKDRK